MPDYPARIDELASFCILNYGLDRVDLEFLLLALVDSTPYPPIWLVCDSSKHPFWEHLDEYMEWKFDSKCRNLGWYRHPRPRFVNQTVDEVIEDRMRPRIWTDHYYNLPHPNTHVRSRYWEMVSEFLRYPVRLRPIPIPPINMDKELFRLINRAVDRENRRFLPSPVRPSEHLLFLIELIMKLNPELQSQTALVRNLTLIPSSRAALFDRTSLNVSDYTPLMQALRHQIGGLREQVIQAFHGERWLSTNDIQCKVGRPDVQGTVKWLTEQGIIDRHRRGSSYIKLTELGVEALGLLNGVWKVEEMMG